MSAFTDEQYRFVVERLAEGDSHISVAAQVNAEWKDCKCTARDVAALSRDKLPADWQGYFDTWRAAFVAGAPTSDVGFRIALLDKWAREAAGRGAVSDAARYLELIEKIQAGFFAGKSAGGGAPDTKTPEFKSVEVVHTIVDPAPQPEAAE